MKWRHSILEESDFRTEWHARVAALRLAFECDTLSSVDATPQTRCDRHPMYKRKSVTFDESFSLFCCADDQFLCSSCTGTHGLVQSCIRRFEQKYLRDVDPLSCQAVLISPPEISMSTDATSFMQKPASVRSPTCHNEPDAPAWYPPPATGFQPDAVEDDILTEHADTDSSEQDSPDEQDPNDPNPDPPDDSIVHPPNFDPNRQSALLYHVQDPPIHAMMFWTDSERFMSEIALHFQIPREELFDAYELTVRPKDIPDSTVPLIVHCVNDFPHGNNMVLVLFDIEIHGNRLESHHQTHPDTQRKVIPVHTPISREGLLQAADVFEYCSLEHMRCLIELNHTLGRCN